MSKAGSHWDYWTPVWYLGHFVCSAGPPESRASPISARVSPWLSDEVKALIGRALELKSLKDCEALFVLIWDTVAWTSTEHELWACMEAVSVAVLSQTPTFSIHGQTLSLSDSPCKDHSPVFYNTCMLMKWWLNTLWTNWFCWWNIIDSKNKWTDTLYG